MPNGNDIHHVTKVMFIEIWHMEKYVESSEIFFLVFHFNCQYIQRSYPKGQGMRCQYPKFLTKFGAVNFGLPPQRQILRQGMQLVSSNHRCHNDPTVAWVNGRPGWHVCSLDSSIVEITMCSLEYRVRIWLLAECRSLFLPLFVVAVKTLRRMLSP